jgi:glutamine phosphoribosylpyrophosphate amidotransferase
VGQDQGGDQCAQGGAGSDTINYGSSSFLVSINLNLGNAFGGDAAGLRPLALGMIGERYCLASESCALYLVGAEPVREVGPGELVLLDEAVETRQVAYPEGRLCLFEFIYLARPDSSSSRSSSVFVRLPLWPRATVRARPWWTSGCAFAQRVEPVVE